MTDGRLADAEALTHFARQVIGVVLVSWQRVLRAGLITAVATLLVAESVACLVTGSFPPPPIAHLVTGLLALVCGYSVAVTTLFALLLRGGVRFIHRLEGDSAVGAVAASVFARREVGDLGAGIRRFLQDRREKAPRRTVPSRPRPATRPRPVTPSRGGVSPVAVAAVGVDVARVAMPYNLPADVRRDPDDAVIRTPPPVIQSLPVLAARLPRIGWTYDEQATPGVPSPAASAPSPNPPAFSTLVDRPDSAEVVTAALAPAGAEASDVPEAPQAPESRDAVSSIPDAPGLIPRGWRRPEAATRPLPAITRPMPTPSGARSGSLWDRLSQALVGQDQAETHSEDEEASQHEHTPVPHDVVPEDAWLNE